MFHPFQLVKNGCERALHWFIADALANFFPPDMKVFQAQNGRLYFLKGDPNSYGGRVVIAPLVDNVSKKTSSEDKNTLASILVADVKAIYKPEDRDGYFLVTGPQKSIHEASQ